MRIKTPLLALLVLFTLSGCKQQATRSSDPDVPPVGQPPPATQYQVTVTVSGPGSVTDTGNSVNCSTTCTVSVAAGSTMNLTPRASSGAYFDHWSGACGTAAQCSITVNAPMSITAIFSVESPAPPPPTGDVLANMLNFAETWARNWNYGGHTVTEAFGEDQGRWDYTDTTYEPWLFDRATVGYRLFELTGDTRWRTQFLSDFAWYRAHIDAEGIFTPKGDGDTKYGYVTPFVLYEKLTGDQQYRPVAKRIYDSWIREWPDDYNPGTGLWTEREIGFALEAAVAWYELTADAAALNRANALVHQWTVVSGNAGAPLHTLAQHGEEFDNAYAAMKMTSTWMSALYFQAAHRLYDITNNAEVLTQVSNYADFLDANGIVDGAVVHSSMSGIMLPYYLYGIGIHYDRETPSEGDASHALDTAGLLSFAVKAKVILGRDTSRAQLRLNQMKATAQWEFDEWTRTTTYLPKYRVNPPRKYNWQLRGYYEDVH